jgi:hypothetical protein
MPDSPSLQEKWRPALSCQLCWRPEKMGEWLVWRAC